ncbi:Histidine kinase [Candidatus Filomicrobium marinum]|uniref:Histidine kinase n=1 Tax=Candidatus Filomicrobium marinum TaxID=1608628 RepID=A0A0D6JIV3_9HYPH|nr:TIGR02281 family clan AA aspartic protease [Candidatus Filomicrobium marinum]CFX33634.1 Histidine kinase [Candidatus Filomicrobium marinum]CPR21904.1 Histidine kinase [Candidatus Filomicrobium marinum]
MLGWLVAILAVLIGVFYFLSGNTAVIAEMGGLERWLLVISAALICLYAGVLLMGHGGRFMQAVRHLGIWLVIGLLLIVGYTYRNDVSMVANRVAGELLPPGETMTVTRNGDGPASVRIRQRKDGHFTARAKVNGAHLFMLVDTGASTVVLKPADAERAGIDTSTLSFTIPVRTANGTGFAAPVRLRSVSIGPIALDNVEALVAKPGALNESLLGMSFLRRLRSYEFSGEFLTLRS